MNNQPLSSAPVRSARHPLGLTIPAILGLALLAVPRVVLHDLSIIQSGTWVNSLFVFVPLIVWIVVVIAARVPRPFLTLLVVGICYGVLLATVHQVFWGASFPDGPPSLGGNLSQIDPALQAVFFRGATAISSLFTGTVIGVLTGLVAELVALVIRAIGRAGR
ncbi:hypothetical protein [Brachybacterium fresconis]|uniref:Uncharacterized protein n=1 Tax=Brachybacterium fresconis TaxID=173363 RepID=A0ABS4YK28_9MICO|nr:hypothetical protein [Brachybacterium fresconis]MBP2409156.1 hypothetical protein [Brachybacterium fresconis]